MGKKKTQGQIIISWPTGGPVPEVTVKSAGGDVRIVHTTDALINIKGVAEFLSVCQIEPIPSPTLFKLPEPCRITVTKNVKIGKLKTS